MKYSITSRRWWTIPSRTALLVLLLSWRILPCRPYHVGDVVDTDVVLDSVRSDALRSQMPMFGIGYVAQVRFEVPATVRTFSLQFEDGLWSLPVSLTTKSGSITGTKPRQFLDRIKVEFVYSKSGSGAIHAVNTKDVIYSVSQQPHFTVEYHWVEEETVNIMAGQSIMFLAVVIASIYFLLLSCGVLGDDDTDSVSNTGNVQSASVPKWD